MAWTATVHQGGVPLLKKCTSCGRPCYDTCELPTRDRICLTCVAHELSKAETELDVDRERRLVNVKTGGAS